MGAKFCKCCCCCTCGEKTNSVGVVPANNVKVLLLGLSGSGKTEIGHKLSHKLRRDFEATNGVQYYEMQLPARTLSITEIGGNDEMQKLWQHYFVTTMGIIYCFDMAASYEQLQLAFDCLQRTLMHPFVRGKPVLLVATKADLVDEGVQLFDIEHAFQLEALARYYACQVHLCTAGHSAPPLYNDEQQSLLLGVGWLVRMIIDNWEMLQVRIQGDTNMQAWQRQVEKLIVEGRSYRRMEEHMKNVRRKRLWYRSLGPFRARRVRPGTAPANLQTAPKVTSNPALSKPNLTQALVPNNHEEYMTASPTSIGKVTEV